MKKILRTIAIFMVVCITACLPGVTAVAAEGTTIEINSGEPLIMVPGESIVATPFDGIPIEVKNLPEFDPGNGFAAFELDLNWDPSVIQFDDLTVSAENWMILTVGVPDQVNGTVPVVGYTLDYIAEDSIIFYLGITAVGDEGDTGNMDIVVEEFIDAYLNPIPVEPVGTSVVIPAPEPELMVNWLAPLATADPYIARCGRTIPVKFELMDDEDVAVIDAEPVVTITRDSDGVIVFSDTAVFHPCIQAYKVHVSTRGWEYGDYTITVSDTEDSYALQLVKKGRG